MKGRFIVFEGPDGSGQTTQVRLLAEYLGAHGRMIKLGKEPTSDSAAGKEIAEVLTHRKSVSAEELQKLFVADRAEHLAAVIIPAITAGNIVIEDRYIMSTLAFGSIACDPAWLKDLNKDFLWPDATIILKVRPEVSLARISGRGKPAEFFEKQEKLEKVAVAYDRLATEFPNCFVIDAEQSIEAVHQEVLQRLAQVLQ